MADVFKELTLWATMQNIYGTKRVVVVHVENNIGDKGVPMIRFYENLRDRVGFENVYTPLDYLDDFPNGRNINRTDGKLSLPSKELTRQHVLDAGKRFFFLISDGAPGHGNEVYDAFFWHFGAIKRETASGNSDALDDWLQGEHVAEYTGSGGVSHTDGKFRNNDTSWSWKKTEPDDQAQNGGSQDCAILKNTDGWDDRECTQTCVYV